MPDAANSTFSPELTATFAAVQQHFRQVIVPLWQGPGWNAELALPYEALSPTHQPLPPQRYRAMARARQLYVFASLIDDPAFPDLSNKDIKLFKYGPANKSTIYTQIYPAAEDVGKKGFVFVFMQ